ncbi:MAG: right-handed parallel beta-helix repeat-containing protein [Deltaproteobacteria bacterium]|nr:right-handed parallel beta-helix repeat-containing protein [Deltaproteobacteria bacterium]
MLCFFRQQLPQVGSNLYPVVRGFLFLLILFLPLETVCGAVITVCPGSGCDYAHIEPALDNAAAHDEIRVAGGTYHQGFSVRDWHAAPLTVSGGWDPTFTVQDPDQYETVLQGASIAATENDGQEITIEALTVTGSYQGVYAYNTQPSGRILLKITLRNLKIYGNSSSGIFLDDLDTATIEHCRVFDNGGIYGAVRIQEHRQANVRNNIIHSNPDSIGLELGYTKTGDSIIGNILYANQSGMNFQRYLDVNPAPTVTGNQVYNHAGDGFNFLAVAPVMINNLSHHNGGNGAYFSSLSGNAVISNNTFIHNLENGIKFNYGNGTPTINNNIFAYNFRGAEFISGSWGASNIRPTSFKNNCFHGSQAPHLLYMGTTAGGFNTEEGSFGNLNDIRFPDEPDMAFARGNFIENPGFLDPEHGDFSLRPTSYLIDEGEPGAPFANEPAPNGGRVNVGADGNATGAAASPEPPLVAQVVATVNGNEVTVTFDTNTATENLRISGEYWDSRDTTWKPFTVKSGLVFGRIPSGPSRQLSWDVSSNINPGELIENSKVRITAAHGNDSANAESNTFNIDFTQPVIQVLPELLEVWTQEGGNAFSTTFEVKNAGGQEPAYALAADRPWLAVNPTGGNLNIPGEAIEVSFDTASLPPGDHNGQITITAAGVANSPKVMPVLVHINPCGYSLDGWGQAIGAELFGGSILVNAAWGCAWQAESNQPWLVLPWGNSGNGTGNVSWQAAANTGAPRTATLTVTGTNFTGAFTVNQAGTAPPQFSVTVQGAGAAAGTITAHPGGLQYDYPEVNSGATGPLDQGTAVVITAAAAPGAVATWNGSCLAAGGTEAGNHTPTATCANTLTADLQVSAAFDQAAVADQKIFLPLVKK